MKRFFRVLAAALTLCMLAAILCGCGKAADGNTARFINDSDGYAEAVIQALPGYENAGTIRAVTRIGPGEIVDSMDNAAEELIGIGAAEHWLPLVKLTAVIAVDRDMTGERIESWSDLAELGSRVYFGNNWGQALLLAAVSYGLEGERFTFDSAIELLCELRGEGRLERADTDVPVMICFDHQAAQMKLAGRNIEIILPREGTLTFERGLLSSEEPAVGEELFGRLKAAGFRTVSGECDARLYPPEEEYEKAKELESYEHLNTVCQDSSKLLRRRVEHTRLYSSADQREHILVAAFFMMAVAVWSYSVIRRTQRWETRCIATVMGIMLSGWVLLRCVKYQLSGSDIFSRLCWYGYYISMIGLPLCMLALALVVDSDAPGRRTVVVLSAASAVYLTLLLLILTNDLHMLVFRFDPNGDWSEEYSYGPVYYAAIAFTVAMFAAAVVLLLWRTRHSPRRYGILFPIMFAALLLGYGVGYISGLSVFRNGDFTITVCAFAMLFFESAMRSGMVPNNTGYASLFVLSPLNMQLIDGGGEVVLAAAGSDVLPEEVRRRLAESPEQPAVLDEDTVVYANRINGGTVMWQEDRSSINRLYAELRSTRAQLVRTNEILALEERNRRKIFAAEERSRLFEQMEREISDSLAELSEMIRPLGKNGENRRETARIMLLLCYIKRRCNMYFIGSGEDESQNMPCNDIGVYLDELAELTSFSGVRCVVNFLLRGELPLTYAVLIYDFVHDSLRCCAENGVTALLVTVGETEDMLCLGMTASDRLGADFISDASWGLIERLGASVELIDPEDCAGLRLIIPKGGEADG